MDKVDAGRGTFGRVAATLVGRRRVGRWRDAIGVRGRFGRYPNHNAIGAALPFGGDATRRGA